MTRFDLAQGSCQMALSIWIEESMENRLTYRLSKRQINLLLPTLAFQQPILCQK